MSWWNELRERTRRGVSSIEYAIIAVIVGLSIVAGAAALGLSLDDILDMAGTEVGETHDKL